MRDLTPRQKEVLQLVYDIIDDTGMPPTRAEIAKRLGFRSANAAEEHLKALQKKGALELIPGASRGIRLPDAVNDSMREDQGLPLVGRVAAGAPILAQEHIEGRYQVDPSLFHPKPHYLLQVHGMSMKDVGIFSGDLVAVHRTPDVRHNQIIVTIVREFWATRRYLISTL